MSIVLLAEALLVLPVARIASRTVPFVKVAGRLGWSPGEAAAGLGEAELTLAAKVGAAVDLARRIYRMEDACLAQSYTTKSMLGRRGIATTLVFGWRIKGSAALAPEFVRVAHTAFHAWVEADGQSVTCEFASAHTTVSRYC